jgi:hypothetical protein
VYWEHFVAQDRSGKPFRRDAINRAYQFCYRKLGFKPTQFTSAHRRGVYLARLYENADDFLCGRISGEALRPAFDNSTAYLVELWKTKYATKRVEKLLQDDRVSREILFYDGLVGASWEETRTRYLSQVGR